ncbi:MAG: hypothetical protein U9P72_06320, partial [Campylobacterota bacterium]|nr:hypothetical protein [Campylobacterota bacterium]
ETGLTKEETIKVTNTDGTLTETTKFIDESGESVEVEVQTKLSTAETQTKDDGTVVTTATATTDDGEALQIQVQINPNGTVQNSFTIGDKSSDVDVAIVGADTVIREDGAIETTAKVTSDTGDNLTTKVEVKIDGTTTSSVEIVDASSKKTTAEITVAIVGADTRVKSDGAIETTAEITTAENVKTVAKVEVKADGATANSVEVTNSTGELVVTKLDTNIAGASSSISTDGSITIKTPTLEVQTGEKIAIEVVVNNTGSVKPNIILEDKIIEMPEFEAGSDVNVKQENGKVLVEVRTILNKSITYNQGN